MILSAEENLELEKARQEWEALESVQPGEITSHRFICLNLQFAGLQITDVASPPLLLPALTEDSNPSPLISFNEALQYFQTTDLGDLLVRTLHMSGETAPTARTMNFKYYGRNKAKNKIDRITTLVDNAV